MKRSLWLLCACFAFCPATLWAQKKNEAIAVFKDGFSIKGRVAQPKETIIDPYTGQGFNVPAGSLYMDDMVRRILFSPGQLQEVIEIKEPPKEFMVLYRPGSTKRGEPMLPGWRIESISPWNPDKWDRVLNVKTEFGRLDLVQRITHIYPYSIHGLTIGTNWDFAYLTSEFATSELDRKTIYDFVKAFFEREAKLKDYEKRFNVAKFLQLCGWFDMADKELAEVAVRFPEMESAVKDYRMQVRKQQVELLAGELDRLQKAGMHEEVGKRIDFLKDEETSSLLSDRNRLIVQETKLKYEGLAAQLTELEQYLKDLPARASDRKLWSAACKVILEELNPDTAQRLETFARIAKQHSKQLQDGQTPTQKTDEVLALAVSGWLQGDSAAVPDVKAAARLFRTREFVLNYLRTESGANRTQALASFTKQADIPLDVLIPLIQLLPPTHATTEKLEASEPTKMSIEVPDSEGGKYYLKLPPEYSPQRAYPVLVLCHSNREKPDVLLKRWQEEAAKHGFILAAPLWGQNLTPVYQYSKTEHEVVLDTVRDLRRRFNIDSDRLFLYGWEQGANAAIDIGLSHPDQFAGVLPMNAAVRPYTQACWSNAQYLPFYVVEGDRNGGHPKATRALFKDWIRGNYPAIYIEYKGRSSEMFLGEIPIMMDWMSRKKRMRPTRGMGRYAQGGGVGEEFKTMRASDNRFYWLSTDEISSNFLSEQGSFAKSTQPATLQASLAVVNDAGFKGDAKIWSTFQIRTAGIRQVTLSIAPNQIDFAKDVKIIWNSKQYGAIRKIQPSVQTLLEELYATGDRQKLVVAKIDLRL